MKIYIAGKISNDPDYRAKFADAQRQIEAQGHIVLNPATLPEGMEPKDYMRICFAMIDVADEVWMMPRWAASDGAAIEWRYCRYICKNYEVLSSMKWFQPWKKEDNHEN
nr:MAG TPA: N-deoxyribosyltransferase [Caudoviricetes sp.]